MYDDEVRKWVSEIGVDNIGSKLVNSREGPPTFEQPKITIEKLLEYGNMLVQEQENVKRVQLADKYLKDAALGEANKDAIDRGTYYGNKLSCPTFNLHVNIFLRGKKVEKLLRKCVVQAKQLSKLLFLCLKVALIPMRSTSIQRLEVMMEAAHTNYNCYFYATTCIMYCSVQHVEAGGTIFQSTVGHCPIV